MEKYLKALMEESGLVVPKIHDLPRLLSSLTALFPSLRVFRRGMQALTDYAVDTRYPGNATTKRQAAAALRWAEKVRSVARALLSPKPTAKKTK